MRRASLGLCGLALPGLLAGCLHMVPYQSTFMTGDCDHDELLSYDEVSRFTCTFHKSGETMTQAKFSRADTNHDDKLNYSEFVALFMNEQIDNAWITKNCQ